MFLNNVTGYTTSKNNVEVALTGLYSDSGKTLNGRTKVLDKEGVAYWVSTETITSIQAEEIELRHKAQEAYEKFKTQETHVKKPTKPSVESRPQAVSQPERAFIRHTVSRGETLHSIANRYNIDPSLLASVNGRNRFAIGSTVKVPR